MVEQGLLDARDGRTSVESLLVAMCAPRLEALGLPAYGPAGPVQEPELALYALLGASNAPDPYSRYNALRRELSSFVHALEQRIGRRERAGDDRRPE